MNTRDILITDDQADRSPNWRGLRVSGMSRVQRDEHLFYGNGSLNRMTVSVSVAQKRTFMCFLPLS